MLLNMFRFSKLKKNNSGNNMLRFRRFAVAPKIKVPVIMILDKFIILN